MLLLNFIRGALIGIAEVIPGVSGGTIALITGVYARIIESANSLVTGVLGLVLRGRAGRSLALSKLAAVDLRLVLPLLTGMLIAVLVAARFIEPLLTSFPTLTRAFFAGLIIASLAIPYQMVGARWKAADYLAGIGFAALAFILTGLAPATVVEPNLITVVLVAALAVTALALPGVSGSFLLLALGFYAPTIAAVNNLDFGYLGAFVIGAILGLAAFVRVLRWLLESWRRITLVAMTGLMLGSLRALWPWQDAQRQLLAPAPAFAAELIFFVCGIVLILTIGLIESKFRAK